MRRHLRHLALAATVFGAFAALTAMALPLPARPSGGESGGHANQGYLGVSLRDPSNKESANLPSGTAHGTEIVRVDHDGPAGKAGLRENDLILQLNGQAISGHDQLKHLLHDVAPGQTESLLILREGQQITVSTQLETREAVEHRAWEQHIAAQTNSQTNSQTSSQTSGPAAGDPTPVAAAAPPSPAGFFHGSPFADATHHTHSLLGSVLGGPYTGLSLEPLTPQLGAFFGVEGGTGLLVRSVEPNSPAMVAGLRAGDVIVSVNQVPVTTENEWVREMHESKGRAVPLTLMRDHHQETVTLTPESKHKARLVAPVSPAAVPRRPETDIVTAPAFSILARPNS